MKKLSNIVKIILSLKTIYRKTLLLIIDLILIFLSYFIFFNLYRSNLSGIIINDYYALILITLIVAIPLYIFNGQYKSLTRYITSFSLYRMAFRNILLFVISAFITYLLGFKILSIKAFSLIWLVNNVSSGFIKIMLSDILSQISKKKEKQLKRVAIYGAGESGAELAKPLTDQNLKFLNFLLMIINLFMEDLLTNIQYMHQTILLNMKTKLI